MRRATLIPAAVAALGAVAYLLAAPPSADLAAQEYRAGLGLVIWDNGWYGGHHMPGYSVLYPPLGALLGARATGALAAVAAAALFAPLAVGHWGRRAGGAAALWFAVAVAALLLTGRVTFLLGAAFGVGALLALARGRRGGALALAAATTLASPVAGLFVALGATAWALAERRRLGIVVAAAALVPVAATTLLFPEGGSEPFAPSAFWPALGAALVVGALLPARERTLRVAALLYAAGLVAAFALSTPLGGNVTRLGALAGGPVVLGALAGRRGPAVVAALALPLAYWALYPPLRDVARASGDPSVQAAYHEPLVRWLQARPGAFRVEIPFTQSHWEARHVAPAMALARGWERQLDRRYGALFYDGTLDAASYRAWLRELAVRLRRGPRRAARRGRPRRGAPHRGRAALPARGLARPALAGPRRGRGTAARRRRRRAPVGDRRHAARRPRRRRAPARAPHAVVAHRGGTRLRGRRARGHDARARQGARHDPPAGAADRADLPLRPAGPAFAAGRRGDRQASRARRDVP